MQAEFEAADTVLDEQIDRLMARFKTTEPEFYAAFAAAREIVDNPGGRAAKNGNNGHETPVPVPQ